MTKREKIASILVILAIIGTLLPICLSSIMFSLPSQTINFSYSLHESVSGSEEGTITNAYVYDSDLEIEYSYLLYAHRNGEAEFLSGNTFIYKFHDITYKFHFDDFNNPTVTFPINDKTYTIYDDSENITIKRVSKIPIFKKQIVATLPDEDCFYSPIEVRNLDNYAVILIDPSENDTDHISVYVQGKEGWVQTSFTLPDGTSRELFEGYARRHFNPTPYTKGMWGNFDGYIGDLELCQTNADGTATLYDVTYSDGQLLLTESKQYENGLPSDWKF